jgi:iron complex outermembrane receptor protein
MKRLLPRASCSLLFVAVLHAQSSPADGAFRDAVDTTPTETPVTIGPLEVNDSALGRSGLASTQLTLASSPLADTQTLSDEFAGFHIATSGAHSFNDTISLRGLSNTPIFGAPAVAVYLDEIPLLGAATLPDALGGLGGASLLRGPAESGKFGYAGPAGVLQLHSPAALLFNASSTASTSRAGSVTAIFGDHALRTGVASAGFAARKQTSLFVALSARSRDGYVFNRTPGQDLDHQDNRSGLLRVETRPFTPLTLALTVHATRSRDGEQPLVPLDGPLFEVERANAGFTEHDALNAGLNATIDNTHGRLSATASINRWDLGPYRSVLTFGPAELLNDAALSRRNRNLELRFTSPLEDEAGWSAGAFFSHAETDGSFARAIGGFTFEQSSYAITDRPFAAHADVWWRFAQNWKITAGLRAEHNDQTFVRHEQIPTDQIYSLRADDTALLPRIQLTKTIDARTDASLALSVGRKPGGFSAFTGNRDLAAFGPERTRAAEAAVTRSFPDQRLRSTLRAFWYEVSGYQIERSFATGASTDDYLVVNAAHARSAGGEWETSWQATGALSFRADIGASRVTLREFADPYSGVRYDGRRAPYSPAYDLGLAAIGRLPAGFEITLGVNSTGRIDYTEGEDLRYAQRAFTLLNASIGYRAHRWRAELSMRNLTDEGYYSSITPGTEHGTPGAPRTIALTIEIFTPAR